MVAVGFYAALATIKRLAPRAGLDAEQAADLAFWLIAVGFVGARAVFVITRWSDFAVDPLAILRFWEGGLVFFGGPLLALPFGAWWMRRKGLSIWKGIDVFLPAVTIAHAFGRLGCLAAGCCYGRPADVPWAVRLSSDLVDQAHRNIPLHPVQLYESFALTVLFLGLLWLFPRRKFDGQVGFTYLLAYPIVRSLVELYRGDAVRGFVIEGWLSTSQFISVVMFSVSFLFLVLRLRSLAQSSGDSSKGSSSAKSQRRA
jgi:phosphatidylglycerol:prolipoprotein diacylglycerol transferase